MEVQNCVGIVSLMIQQTESYDIAEISTFLGLNTLGI